MIPCGPILEELLDQMNNPSGTADEAYKKQGMRKLNEAYRDVAGAFPWNSLKTVVTLTDDVYRLPADCNQVMKVIDDNKLPYNFVPGQNRKSFYERNWYFTTPVSTALAEGTTLSVSDYSTAVSSTAEFPATDCADEYIRIGENTGIYKIASWTDTSNITLDDNFRGDNIAGGRFQIRPKGTRIMAFCDPAGTEMTPSDVEVTYIRFPLPLYLPEDMIELPGYCPAVRIKALQKLLAMAGFNQAADRKDEEYRSALTEMMASEPSDNQQQPTNMFATSRYKRESQSYLRGLSLINQ